MIQKSPHMNNMIEYDWKGLHVLNALNKICIILLINIKKEIKNSKMFEKLTKNCLTQKFVHAACF